MLTPMKTPGAIQPEDQSVEALLESLGILSHLPENTVHEASAKRDAYNSALNLLEQRLSSVHLQNETGDQSLDDAGPEEAADERERNLIGPAMIEFRGQMARLHGVIIRLSGQQPEVSKQ